MKKLILIALISLLPFAAWPRGGDETHNGGGITEQNIIFAWNALSEFTSFCGEGECTTDQDAKRLMTLIANNKASELQSGQILFVEATKRPDLFKNPSNLIFTESRWGARIYINKQSLPELDIRGAFALLAFPLAIHAGIQDFHQLKSIKQAFSEMAQTRYIETSLVAYRQPQTRFVTWSFPHASRAILADHQVSIDLTASLATSISCPDSRSVRSLKVSRLVWDDLVSWDKENQIQDFSFRGDLSYECVTTSQVLRFKRKFQGLIQAQTTLDGRPEANWFEHSEARLDFIPSSLQWIFSPAQNLKDEAR